jgi:hypothetical protein
VRTRVLPILLAVLAATTLPFAAAADAQRLAKKRRHHVFRSPDLWATINVCDTLEHPDTIGIRGSMPGLGRRSTLWIRFRVQYLASVDGRWHNIADDADSGWMRVGRTRGKVVESGQNFTFLPPSGGGAHRLRGSVRFKWVRHKRVLERERRVTEAGHRSTAGADPDGYSAAVCDIT